MGLLSGKNFRDPLLRVLGTKMEFKLGEVIPYEITYDPICAILGITRDLHGNCSTGIPWVERWIQFAYKDLINEGLATKAGKGKWTLTQAGLDASAALCKPTMQGDGMSDASTAILPPDPGVCLEIGAGNPEDGYHPDAFIRSLAINAADGCFGCYTPRSPVCTTCPIKGNCMNGLSATLTMLVKTMATEDAEETKKEAMRLAKANAPVTVAATAATAATVTPAAATVPPLDMSGVGVNFRRIALSAAGKCRKCGNDIQPQTRSVWMRSAAGGTGSAIYHGDCFKQLYPNENAALEASEKAKKA